ncbi:carboxypeptidase-like regulatory domain-containing protein [Flavobacterium sp. J27]|uniref:carboxypeptidase-like regulatory domain-containing protein n=1 Tax=Flavobacterium sp. J27 TaxID=2060419 RepID=UPI0010304AC0|nr:carboxypeptidase-like regulatory domain-containing protein [Flavobacterium sp. J27]
MKQKLPYLFFLFFCHCICFAQIKGIVKDSISSEPIPFVNIWVENEEIGTTSDLDGSFSLHIKDINKNLIFSALGFHKKMIPAKQSEVVFLKATVIELNEVVLLNKKETKSIEIGKTPNAILQTFDNGPKIEAKFFPYKESYKKTPFIKTVSIQTDSKIEEATLKIHFYEVTEEGAPGKELLQKDFLVKIKKGILKNKIDISTYNLTISQKGIYVAYEKLMIESNALERKNIDPYTKKEKKQKTYYPHVLYNYVERESVYSFYGGKWNKKVNEQEPQEKLTIFEPAINLTLTN